MDKTSKRTSFLIQLTTIVIVILTAFAIHSVADAYNEKSVRDRGGKKKQIRIDQTVGLLESIAVGDIIGLPIKNQQYLSWLIVTKNDSEKQIFYGHRPLSSAEDVHELYYRTIFQYRAPRLTISIIPEEQATQAVLAADAALKKHQQ